MFKATKDILQIKIYVEAQYIKPNRRSFSNREEQSPGPGYQGALGLAPWHFAWNPAVLQKTFWKPTVLIQASHEQKRIRPREAGHSDASRGGAEPVPQLACIYHLRQVLIPSFMSWVSVFSSRVQKSAQVASLMREYEIREKGSCIKYLLCSETNHSRIEWLKTFDHSWLHTFLWVDRTGFLLVSLRVTHAYD